jgi:ribonuclease-3
MKHFDLIDIQKKIGYVFKDWELLFSAFTHASYANEHGVNSYERSEFLGDSILNFVVAEYLFNKYPAQNEGFLTKMRAALVSTKTLAAATDSLGVIEYMRTSSGPIADEVIGSIGVRADLFEAITAAIFLDGGGMEACKKFVLGNLENRISEDSVNTDYKSMLLEKCAQKAVKAVFKTVPVQNGFESAVYIMDEKVGSGVGSSKRRAEQQAAYDYFSKTEQHI